MKFFNLDLHVSVIQDIKQTLEPLGHTVDNWSISGHSWVFDKEMDKVEVVNEKTWQGLDQDMCDRFYDRYKNELSDYDCFIACYPPAFSLLYEKFDKPIIAVAATRYEHPFSGDQDRWGWFNEKLIAMIDSGQITPVSNNKYDKFYCEHFTGRTWDHIPSFCDYTQATYKPVHRWKNACVISSRVNHQVDECKHINSLGRHSWEDLYSHKAIVHVPYNTSIMSISEQYAASVPLLFPTLDFGKRTAGYLSELFFHTNKRIVPSLYDDKAIMLADFYDDTWMPHALFYDSFTDIPEILSSVDLLAVSDSMREFNTTRKLTVTERWEDALSRL
tara:strand:- start:16089 stop:17081 length:993 start_codon:yes stop_codon:yes gene_type:complete